MTHEAALDFDPDDPQIQVFIRTEEDIKSLQGGDMGEWDRRQRRVLTTEYDVFACDAYTEDVGRWLRLMPDADFIPTVRASLILALLLPDQQLCLTPPGCVAVIALAKGCFACMGEPLCTARLIRWVSRNGDAHLLCNVSVGACHV